MKTFWYVLVLFALISCNRSSDKTATTEGATGTEEAGPFSAGVQKLIGSITDLDCQLYTLYGELVAGEVTDQQREKVRQLRVERVKLEKDLAGQVADTAELALVQSEIKRLSKLDEFCPGWKAQQQQTGDKAGVPKEPLNIREDARKLANLNCEIKELFQKIQATPANPEMRKQMKSLQDKKRTMLNQLMLMYGQEVIRDGHFRSMVLQIQEKQCNYVEDLKAFNKI